MESEFVACNACMIHIHSHCVPDAQNDSTSDKASYFYKIQTLHDHQEACYDLVKNDSSHYTLWEKLPKTPLHSYGTRIRSQFFYHQFQRCVKDKFNN